MQHSPSWEANSFSASQKIPHILCKPKVHYRIHKSSSPVPILSHSRFHDRNVNFSFFLFVVHDPPMTLQWPSNDPPMTPQWPSNPILRFRPTFADRTRRRQRFNARPVHQNSVVDKVALWQIFLPVLRFSPRHYHSTIAPYSFIHLPPTLYNVSLPVLQFSPVNIIPPLLHTQSFTYHPLYIIFSPSTSVFPLSLTLCHCSLHALHSFVVAKTLLVVGAGVRGQAGNSGSTAHAPPSVFYPFHKHPQWLQL
jgi:hypothetical protein